MSKKAQAEFPVKFLVSLVIALVVFGFSIYLVVNLFKGAQEQQATIDKQTEDAIKRLLVSGEQVALPINSQTVKKGTPTVFFGMGIYNTGDEKSYHLNHKVALSQSSKGDVKLEENSIIYIEEQKLKPNEQVIVPIAINTKKLPEGTYIVDIWVCKGSDSCQPGDENSYGALQKIRINIIE